MCDGFYPFPRIYPAWIYPCDDHTYPGYYRFAFDGTEKGGALGFLFGLTSFINNTMNPTPTSFVFTPFYSIAGVSGGWGSVIICFLPRILVGIIPYYVYKLIIRFSNEKTKKTGVSSIGLVTAGVAGAMTNTLLVMNLIFCFQGSICIGK